MVRFNLCLVVGVVVGGVVCFLVGLVVCGGCVCFGVFG